MNSKDVIRARREREKQHRIDTILNSAQKVFFEKGFIKATMDEIALGAEISKPTIYQYFDNKEDLFLSFSLPIIEQIHESMLAIEQLLEDNKILNAQHLFQEIFNCYFLVYKNSPEMFSVLQVFQETKLLFGLGTQIKDEIIKKGRENYTSLRRVLSKAMALAIIKKCDPFPLADLVWATTVGIIQVEDIKGDSERNHKFKKVAFAKAVEVYAVSLAPQN